MSLEDDSKTRKPKNLRKSKHAQIQGQAIQMLREVNPKLGKIRIAKILKETGYNISPSTVSRITRLLSTPKKPI